MAMYLRNEETGVVFAFDSEWARYPHMKPCNADGSDMVEDAAGMPVSVPVDEAPVAEEAPAKAPSKKAAK